MDWTAMAAPWLKVEAQTDVAHRPVLDGILQRADLRPGEHVLDVGPGGGVSLLAEVAAVGPSGRVTGIEIAPPFVERANQRLGGAATVLQGDAQTHPFDPASFDVIFSLFGVMFFQDSQAAFENLRYAVKPGGRMHFACWGPPQNNPWFSLSGAAAAEVFGPGDPPDPNAPGPMRFADPDTLAAMLMAAGWTPEVEVVDLELTPEGGVEGTVKLMMTIGGAAHRMGLEKEAGRLTEASKRAVRDGLQRGFQQYERGDEVYVPARINFVSATPTA